MKSLIRLTLACGLTLTSMAAQAMRAAPLAGEANAVISEAAYGCGPGMTRGPYGECRPRFTCPPGWHPGREGWHCYRNW